MIDTELTVTFLEDGSIELWTYDVKNLDEVKICLHRVQVLKLYYALEEVIVETAEDDR